MQSLYVLPLLLVSSFLTPRCDVLAETLLIDDNDLTGNTDAMCAHTLVHFIADCAHSTLAAAFNCTCCTLCCSRENTTCNDDEWLGNHEAMWEYGYNRLYYNFDDNGIISPYVDYNAYQG